MLKHLWATVGLLLILIGAWLPAPRPVGAQLGVGQLSGENADVVLIVDISGSMQRNDPEAVRVSAARLFVDLARDGDRVAVVTMGGPTTTEVKIKLTRLSSWMDNTSFGRRQMKQDLETLANAPGENTFMGKALDLAYDILEKTEPGRLQYVVMLTDGLPTGESANALTDALDRYRRKHYWRIFPVALGKEIDYAFLQDKVAAPTNGVAFKAATPADLIRVYTEIFALTRENHYVNWVKVTPGALQKIGTITAAQQLTNLAIVIPKMAHQPEVEVLAAPNGKNFADPAARPNTYWADDPRYEVYIIPRESLALEGQWAIRLKSPAEVEIALLARSNLAIQLQTPAPRAPWDELSERYYPEGEPLYVRMGVQRYLTGIEAILAQVSQQQGQNLNYQLYLTPAVLLDQANARPLILRDDGQFSDFERDDGVYSARASKPLASGHYTLEFELPGLKSNTLRLIKRRAIEVLPLPRVQMKLPDGPVSPGTVALDIAFTQAAGSGAPTLNDNLLVQVREPDGHVYSAPAVQSGDRYRVQINAAKAGRYYLAALASVTAQVGSRSIPYSTYDERELVVARPEISARAVASDLGVRSELADLRVKVTLTSNSLKAETLRVRVADLSDATVVPATVSIGAKENKTIEFSIGTTTLATAGGGTFALVFSAGDAAAMTDERVTFSYEVAQAIEVSSPKTDLGKFSNLSNLKVQLRARSASPREEALTVRVEGLGESAEVFPNTLVVPPKEETAFTLLIKGAKSGFTGPRRFDVMLEPANSGISVKPERVTFSYELPKLGGPGPAIAVIGLLIVGGLVAFLILRRRR
ncbi:MAG: VWA domain-containing protein [Chloroflexi bacterium]|nr:VWA domain-containing protein [Chloroflexota bacterium]